MSSRKSRNKKPPLEKTSKELEDEKLIDEALPDDDEEEEEGGEQYEEYDPNDVYDDEKEPPQDVIDVNNLSQKQRVKYERDNKRLFFLKALSLDPYQDIGKLAVKKCKLIDKGEGETMVQLMIGMIMETSKEKDFPNRILNYFNKLVPDGYPNKITLDKDDVNELTNLAQVYEDKLMNQAKVTDPDKIFGDELNAETIKDAKEKKRITMMDASQNFTMNPSQQQPAEQSSSLDYYINKYAIPDIGIMEMALNSIPNPRPNSIPHFITNFTDLYTDWMNNPLKILEQLKFFFGPTHGEHAFRIWRDYRENYQKKQGYSQLGGMNQNQMGMTSMGSGEYQPYQGFNQYGFQPMQASPEVEAERMMDRRMDKLMKMLQFKMMNQAMENQTPLPQSGQGYEEIYDQNGKVIKRIMLPNGHANGNSNPMESAVFQGMMNMMQEMMRGKNNEMLEVMKKITQPDSLLTDFAKTMMGNFVNQSNPVSQIREMLDITNMVKTQSPQDSSLKSIEAVKLDVDSKIAMQELELKKLEMQHNWRMDENQSREQDSNVDKWLNTLQGMGESIIKPVAIKFLEGFGKGQIPGGPLNGQFAQPTLQTPIGANEQDYAMQQQQYYQNMERERARPMAPMQPMQQQQQQQRQFNNQQQPMQQQQAPPPPQQRTISAASERDIETELQQLTPAQIQDIEDKMAIDDINREKVKNAIRAYKNGRRVSRPRPAEQVEEARNVLFNPPVPEELNEDDLDFDDQEEEDYEVPIARGDTKVPPATVQKPSRKFSDFEQKSTTEIAKTKKLNDQQKAMLSSGQMTDRELREIEDAIAGEDEDDEYSSSGVPMPAGLRNASEDIMVEENLKKTKQTPTKKKKEKIVEKVAVEEAQEEQKEAEKVLKEAEQVIEEVPEDVFE